MQHIRPGHHVQGGKYRIERPLGQGAFGITYLAFNLQTQTYVVIKEFSPAALCARNESSPEIFPRTPYAAIEMNRLIVDFINAGVATSGLSHNNIAAITDLFRENNTAYIAWDYIDGQSLHDILQTAELPAPQVLRYIIRLCHAIEHAHEKGINHFDIKPSNIIIRRSDDEPILIDFGLRSLYAAAGQSAPTAEGSGYAPIELTNGQVTAFAPEVDTYSLAATLYKALTLITPPNPIDIQNFGGLTFPPNVSPALQAFVQKAMAFDKSQRFHSPADFRINLAKAFNAETVDDAAETITTSPTPAAPPMPPVEPPMPPVAPPMPEPVAPPMPKVEQPTPPPTPAAAPPMPPVEPPIPKTEIAIEPEQVPAPEPVAPPMPPVAPPMPKTEIVIEPEQTPAPEPVAPPMPPVAPPMPKTEIAIEPEQVSAPEPVKEKIAAEAMIEPAVAKDPEPEETVIALSPTEKTEIVSKPKAAKAKKQKTKTINKDKAKATNEHQKTELINNNDKKSNSKKTILIVIIALLLVGGGAAAYYFMTREKSTPAAVTPTTSDEDSTQTTPVEEPAKTGPKEVTGMEIEIDGLHGTYTGPVNADNLPDGDDGSIEFTNGPISSYKGQWANGQVTGRGEVVYTSGDTFTGVLDNTSFVEGTIRYAGTGRYYEGTFVNDEFYNGTWYDQSGKAIAKVVNGKEQPI